MKASPGARSWIAAGVRHELLTRALPALRHDMAAPVSVMRMGSLGRRSAQGGQKVFGGGVDERPLVLADEVQVDAVEPEVGQFADAGGEAVDV